jgi:hypothetical protein
LFLAVHQVMDFYLSAPIVPFTLALGLLAGLLVLEIAALLLGGSVLGRDVDQSGLDGFDPGVGLSPDMTAALPAPVELAQMDLGGIVPAELDLGGLSEVAPPTGLGPVLGLGRVPFLIWLAALLAGFGLSGYLVQSLVARVFGGPLPGLIAALPAAAVGLWFARGYGRILARLVPGTESSVRSGAMLNGKRGVVSQGAARSGHPAEVRVLDSFGNLHFIRAEPLDGRDVLAQGAEVLVWRVRRGPARGQFRILPLTDP